MEEQLYIKIEDSPFDEDDLREWNIPIYDFDGEDYIKIDVCDYIGDFSKMFIVDIELTEVIENEGVGNFNGLGATAKKDFHPVSTELIIKESIFIKCLKNNF